MAWGVVVESVVQQTAGGIGYESPVVTVIELGDDHKIRRMSSYYDRLAIMQQVANKSRGLRGGLSKRLVNALVSQAEKGVERPETPRENWELPRSDPLAYPDVPLRAAALRT